MESRELIQIKKSPKEAIQSDSKLKLKGLEKDMLQYFDYATERLHFLNILTNNDNINGKVQNRAIEIFFEKDLLEVKKDLRTIHFMGQQITVHRLVVDNIYKAQAEIKNDKVASKYAFRSVQSYNIRNIFAQKGEKLNLNNISAHSLGLALDINPKNNKYKENTNKRKLPESFARVVEIMKSNGFIWGGDWETPYDPMHFEFTKLSDLALNNQKYLDKIKQRNFSK